MLISRLYPPLRSSVSSIGRIGSKQNPHVCWNESSGALILRATQSLVCIRQASHAAQGAVNSAKDGPGKRLGAKKSGDQYVIPGNIIFRQRGTSWFPGENCGMGRDHTIFALEHGYVKYYKDPENHPKRQYIGVALERHLNLPSPRNGIRRRRLGMVAIKTELPAGPSSNQEELASNIVAPKLRRGEEGRKLSLRTGYMYRERNWEIGRAAERAQVKVRPYKRSDRWLAWRKTILKKKASVERRNLGGKVRKAKR